MALAGMRVVWFIDLNRTFISEDIRICADHVMAGLRLRIGLPAQALAAQGVLNTLVSIAPGDTLPALPARPDIAVFTKPYIYGDAERDRHASRFIDAAETLKRNGTAVVFDQTDNLFADQRRDYALRMLELADAVSTCSTILGALIQEHAGRESWLVPDPLEGRRGEAAFDARSRGLWARLRGAPADAPLRLLWFGGQPATFRALTRWRSELARLAHRQPLKLEVVMNRVPEVEAGVAQMAGDGIAVTLHAWSPAAMAERLADCDLVLLPTDSTNPRSFTASSNRLVAALWAGRFPIAGAIPSYLDFTDYAWVGDNPVAGIDWALAHPQEVLERLRAGQARLEQSFSTAAVGAAWGAMFEGLGRR